MLGAGGKFVEWETPYTEHIYRGAATLNKYLDNVLQLLGSVFS